MARVGVVPLGSKEAEQGFGAPLHKKGVQATWIEIENRSDDPQIFFQSSVDRSYYAPREAAALVHYSPTKRFLSFGLLGIVLWPLLLAVPFQVVSARLANRKMTERFVDSAIYNRALMPEEKAEGFVFTRFDEGIKEVELGLQSPDGRTNYSFFSQVPGVKADWHSVDFDAIHPPEEIRDLDWPELRRALIDLPCCVSNKSGSRTGDPLNLVVIGHLQDVMRAFTISGWDETEVLSFSSTMKTARSFLLKNEYRYSPVSNLYVFDRAQDFALQKARRTVNERNHLRLWYSPYQLQGRPVMVGQVSRDIGVKLTLRTWNLTTHIIDPDTDESRESVLGDLLEAERAKAAAFVPGVGIHTKHNPGRNLTLDPFITDGLRVVIYVSDMDVTDVDWPDWEDPETRALVEQEMRDYEAEVRKLSSPQPD